MSNIFQKPPSNYQYIVGFENNVDFEVTSVIATGAVNGANLQDIIAPANTLVQNGQKLRLVTFGRAAGAGSKRFFCELNGSVIYDGGSLAINNQAFAVILEMLRLSDTTLAVIGFGSYLFALLPATATAETTRTSYGIISNINFAAQMTFQFRADVVGVGETLTHEGSFLSVQ